MSIFDKIGSLFIAKDKDKSQDKFDVTATAEVSQSSQQLHVSEQTPEAVQEPIQQTDKEPALGQQLSVKQPIAAPLQDEKPQHSYQHRESDKIKQINRLISVVVRSLEGVLGSDANLSRKTLNILSDDHLTLSLLQGEEYIVELKERLETTFGDNFHNIKIDRVNGQNSDLSQVDLHLFISIQDAFNGATNSGDKARIVALPDCGSLIDNECIISKEGTYKIGVGRRVKLDSGLLRINQIAISDDVNDPQIENNKYVSRAHAHITYSYSEGFLLYVEIGGTKMRGKRTRILRGDNIIDLLNPIMPYRLQHGDIIELSKSVLLSFTLE